MTVKRIAMWSCPRNISTAMMRSFENRRDTVVIDEPFYACYLKRSGLIHPMNDLILADQSTDDLAVIRDLTVIEPEDADIYYQKLMCHHMIGDIDTSWLSKVTNAFLIRDPRAMVASYAKAMEDVDIGGLGAAQQEAFFDRVADNLGKAPPVIESADMLKDPEGMMRKLCAALDITFDHAMLDWPAGKRDSDGVWAPHWYANVEKSTGFMPYVEHGIDLSIEHEHVAEQCMPAYEKLSKYKL